MQNHSTFKILLLYHKTAIIARFILLFACVLVYILIEDCFNVSRLRIVMSDQYNGIFHYHYIRYYVKGRETISKAAAVVDRAYSA